MVRAVQKWTEQLKCKWQPGRNSCSIPWEWSSASKYRGHEKKVFIEEGTQRRRDKRSLCSSEASTRDISAPDSSTFPASWWPAASPCCHPEFFQHKSERLVEPAPPHWGCFLWNTLLMEGRLLRLERKRVVTVNFPDLHCTLAVWPCQACPKPASCSCRNLPSSSWRGSTATTSYNKPAGGARYKYKHQTFLPQGWAGIT